jgi:hydroxymethylpyrimidine pyrophosphatase-like HAD family hydrolase
VTKAFAIAVDWDGTLVDRNQDWLPDAEWALGKMVKAGWKVTVLSCRASFPTGKASIERKLDESFLSAIEVTDKKPQADVYLDDKALRFNGDWSTVFFGIASVTEE